MTADEIKARIVSTLPRDLLIDLLDTAVARARVRLTNLSAITPT